MFVYIFVSLQVVEMECRELCAIVYTYAHFTYLSSKLANLVHIWRDLGQGWLYGCTPTVDTLTAVSSLLNFDIDRCIYIDTLQYSEEVPTGALQPPGLINLNRSCFNRF